MLIAKKAATPLKANLDRMDDFLAFGPVALTAMNPLRSKQSKKKMP
jgi:hypothetical protein